MFDRILVPLDGTPRSAVVLPLARSLAEVHHSQLVLFRVVETTAERYDASSYLSAIASDLAGSALNVTTDVRIGSDVAAQIAWAVIDSDADLVILAIHGSGVAEALAAFSRVPVLLVRSDDPDARPRLPDVASRQRQSARRRNALIGEPSALLTVR